MGTVKGEGGAPAFVIRHFWAVWQLFEKKSKICLNFVKNSL